MKNKLVILALGMAFLLAGCQNQAAEIPEESVMLSSQEESVSTEDISSQEKTYSIEELPDGSATCTYAEITVTIPAEWKDKYIVQTSENGIYFYQKVSFEVEEGSGYLCAIIKEDNMIDWPETQMIAYTDEHIYYFTRPSDVPCVEVSEIASSYAAMTEYTKQMEESVVLDVKGLCYDMYEYYLPMSATKEIPEEILINMSADSLRIARNEIYAKHGLKFNDQYLNDYFSTCSWYTPSVESEDFDESVLSEVERNNIIKIKAKETLSLEE